MSRVLTVSFSEKVTRVLGGADVNCAPAAGQSPCLAHSGADAGEELSAAPGFATGSSTALHLHHWEEIIMAPGENEQLGRGRRLWLSVYEAPGTILCALHL